MLWAASDVPGTPEQGDQIFISLVVGAEHLFRRMHKEAGVRKMHMPKLDEAQRQRVIDALVFTRNDLSAFCFRVDRQEIVNEVYSHINRRKNFRRKLYIYGKFDEIFLKRFRGELQGTCARSGAELARLGVECDADMEKTAKGWNMMPLDEGIAHEIADAVPWRSMHGAGLPGCLERDFAGTISKKLLAAARR